MDSAEKDKQEVPSHLEEKKLVEFLESFNRICKIGTYYPAGHVILDQAAAQFQKHLTAIAHTNRAVRIELRDGKLSVEGQDIMTLTNALQEFRKLLQDLGIGSLELDRGILLPELLQLIKSLLLGRSQLQGIKEFTQADLANLPESVRVRQKEFLVDAHAILLDGSGEDSRQGLSAIFQVLADQGLEREKIDQCKRFLNSLATTFSRRPLKVKGLPSVTWSDVQNLLIKVVSNAYHLSDKPGGVFAQNDLNALSAIFQGLEGELRDKESQETINLLVSVFRGGSFSKQLEDGAEQSKGIRPADKVPLQSPQQMQSFVQDNFVHRNTLEKINQIDHREELSIYLQLLQFHHEPGVEGKIRQNLRDILNSPMNTREIETLFRGLLYLATRAEPSRFFEVVQFTVIPLRTAKNMSAQKLLAAICQRTAPETRALLWPILVNECLAVDLSVDQKAFRELMTMAARLPGQEMKDRWPALETMDCFQGKKIAPDIFDPELKIAFPLFAFLLETSLKKQIGSRILTSILAHPPDWLIEAVAPLLQLEIPQHMKFLQIYLQLARQSQFSVNLRVAAGTLVVHHLPNISEQQMRETWVAKTIQATPELQIEETRALLERIREEKRMMIVPKWPNACRLAAIDALKKLKRKPL